MVGIDVGHLLRERLFHLVTPDELRDASRRGLRIELHTHDHNFPADDGTALRRTIKRNRAHLSSILGGSFRHFCYPSGRYSPARFGDLEDLGIASATTCESGFADRDTPTLCLPRILDGDGIGEAEFRAEVAGLFELRRRIMRRG